jgi:hypothetical protein
VRIGLNKIGKLLEGLTRLLAGLPKLHGVMNVALSEDRRTYIKYIFVCVGFYLYYKIEKK